MKRNHQSRWMKALLSTKESALDAMPWAHSAQSRKPRLPSAIRVLSITAVRPALGA